MTSLTPTFRDALLDELESEPFDIVVVGGGITGAGVARDAAHRGLRVALVEAGDFAVGTSSRSSKLIHGGLRYLAQGEVGLVRETALERKAVHAMAPHLAEPCWMVVTARNRASLMKFRAGIGTYEKLGAVEDADRHESWDRDTILDREPTLQIGTYPYACAYREYLTDDARLVLAVLRDAVAHGAVVANRLPVVDVVTASGRVAGVEAECDVTARRVRVHGAVVVNAAGPWVEDLVRMEEVHESDRLHLSKGVHVVVSADRLPVRNLVIMGTADKRSIFAIPRGDVVILGTTDTSYGGARSRWPEIEGDDIDYLLDPITRYFDVAPLDRSDVLAAWAGVRPLVAQAGKEAKEMSRKDEVWIGSGGMVTVAGGKLTGFRAMAVTVMESVAAQLGRSIPEGPGPSPIAGGDVEADLDQYASRLSAGTGVPRDATARLVRLYGSDSESVIALGSDPLVTGGQVLAGEVDWAIGHEAALTLEDVIYRRTRAAWYRPTERDDLLAPVVARMAELLEWDDTRLDAEIDGVRARFADELSATAAK